MHKSKPKSRQSITFISSNHVWGGSEVLWAQTAMRLAKANMPVNIFKPRLDSHLGPTRLLGDAGCKLTDLAGPAWWPSKFKTLVSVIWPLARAQILARLRLSFALKRPDLVVISQGINHDGWYLGAFCARLGLRYVMISQKATDLYWPHDNIRSEFRQCYGNASASLFVSEHNRRLTEQQLGFTLPRAAVVRNPYNADWSAPPTPFPSLERGVVLACLARLDTSEKGQDLLFRVLALPQWRARTIEVRLYGAGLHDDGLREMAQFLGLSNVKFCGHVARPEDIWTECHALVLPSRCEGMPLSLIEAMLHGRPSIITDAGGNAEAVIDGATGFLAAAASETALDEAMERAWQSRHEWEGIGRAAAAHARTLTEPDPVGTLADMLVDMISNQAPPVPTA
jgi:glycosyltransferase involved in cell wall biosynthesis